MKFIVWIGTENDRICVAQLEGTPDQVDTYVQRNIFDANFWALAEEFGDDQSWGWQVSPCGDCETDDIGGPLCDSCDRNLYIQIDVVDEFATWNPEPCKL